MRKRMVSALLTLGMALFLLPFAAPARAAEPQDATTLVVSDESDAFKTIQEALGSLTERVDGAVRLQIEKNLTASKETLVLPNDKGIAGFTIGTSQQNGVTISGGSFYANGVPLVVDRGITLSGMTIYGGGAAGADVSGDTSVIIAEGAEVGTIYGGGQESDVGGDVSIRVSGTARNLYGGGHAYAYTDDTSKIAQANVGGKVEISVTGENSKVTGTINGGGYAETSSSKPATQNLTANVMGGVSLFLDSPNLNSQSIYGGGGAQVFVKESDENIFCNVTADVQQDINIVFTARAKSSEEEGDARWLFWGGGYANNQRNTAPNIKASAKVNGNITIDASENAYAGPASVEEWDGSMFVLAYGGGFAAGSNTDATVARDISIRTSRKATNSEHGGLFGGGYADMGGVARVKGNTEVVVCRPSDLKNDVSHENAKNVVGGGYAAANGNSDVTVEKNTRVIIKNYSDLESGNMYGVVGGGVCAVSNGGTADVLGTATVEIGANVSLEGKVIGGGYVTKLSNTAGQASTGKVKLSITGTNAPKVSIYGGGYHAAKTGGTMDTVDITLQDATVANVYPAGQSGGAVTVQHGATLTLLGNTTLSSVWGETVQGGFQVQVGDGEIETTAINQSYFFNNGSKIAKVLVANHATLKGKSTTQRLLWDVNDVEIAEGGKIELALEQTFYGALSGMGTLVLPEGAAMTLQGSLTGKIKLDMAGTVAAGKIMAWTKTNSTTGSFIYPHAGLVYQNEQKNYDGVDWIEWSLSAVTMATVTATVSGEGGTISPASQSVVKGGDATFTITRDPGHKVASLRLGQEDVTDGLINGTLTLTNVQADAELIVTFEKMTAEDIIQALPPLVGDASQPEQVLDTKLDYEALSEEEKGKVPEVEQNKLNEALSKLPNVAVEVAGELKLSETEKPSLMETITRDDALALKDGAACQIIVNAAAASPDEAASSSIEGALQNTTLAVQLDVTVKKVITTQGAAIEQPLTVLPKPIALTFTIPADARAPAAGMTRTFSMLRTHQESDGTYTTERLPQGVLDEENWTYTVKSDRFSVYTLAYTDTSQSSGSGGSGTTTYPVALPQQTANGAISVTPKYAAKGQTVNVTVKPDAGYVLGELTVTDGKGNALPLTDKGDGVFTFTMPASKVSVQAVFAAQHALPFADVTENDWFYDAVCTMYQAGWMNGTAQDRFSPNLTVNRGMLTTMLYRMAGESASPAAELFTDVSSGAYYHNAVLWAAEQGIVTGYGDGRFGPEDAITREQLAAVLYRYAGSPETAGMSLYEFVDGDSVSPYAIDAMLWATENGVVTGKGENRLAPKAHATRAEAAAMLVRFRGQQR